MPDFYYQIKGKANKGQETVFTRAGEVEATWVWPPIFSGKVENCVDAKEAKEKIELEYNKKFSTRVLKKDLDSNEFLLKIEEIKENSRSYDLFKPKSCEYCGKEFLLIDKYNDYNETDKSPIYCGQKCKELSQQAWRDKYYENRNNSFEGIHIPVIYKITNKLTQQCYIGKTNQAFTLRWYQHFFQSKTCKFHESIKQTKLTDWTFEVIEIIDVDIKNNDLNIKTKKELETYVLERERFYINKHDSINNGYNSI